MELYYTPACLIRQKKPKLQLIFLQTLSGMTVVTAIARAGGYTYRAKQDYVYISRAGDSEKKKQRADPNAPIYPGDVIEVPERLF
jgi:polysaccharide export outer membrane protein